MSNWEDAPKPARLDIPTRAKVEYVESPLELAEHLERIKDNDHH